MPDARLLALVVLAAAAAGGTAAQAERQAPRELLPDLDQEAPDELELRERIGGTFRLGFRSAVRNVGAGPILILAHRRSRTERTMVADQLVSRSDGSVRTVPGVGRLSYVRNPTHDHWHLLPFARYELRTVDGRALIGRDAKTGFCLGDRYNAGLRLPAQPQRRILRTTCGRDRPEANSLTQGISVGYGDDYDPHLEGQSIEVTGLPDGRYQLVHRLEATGLRQLRRTNDAASVLIELRLGDSPPVAAIVRSCPDSPRCPPTA